MLGQEEGMHFIIALIVGGIIGWIAGMIMREIVPGVAARAIVLANGAPLPLS